MANNNIILEKCLPMMYKRVIGCSPFDVYYKEVLVFHSQSPFSALNAVQSVRVSVRGVTEM